MVEFSVSASFEEGYLKLFSGVPDTVLDHLIGEHRKVGVVDIQLDLATEAKAVEGVVLVVEVGGEEDGFEMRSRGWRRVRDGEGGQSLVPDEFWDTDGFNKEDLSLPMNVMMGGLRVKLDRAEPADH